MRTAQRTIIGTLETAVIAIVAAMVAGRCVAAVRWVVAWPSDADRWWSLVMVAGVALSIGIVNRAHTTGETTRAFLRGLDDPPTDLRPVPARLAAGVTGVGLGAPLGLDGPALHFGGALGALAARVLRRGERAWTIAAGVAALSMAIDAPVAASLFVIEIGGRRRPRARDLPPLILGAAAGWAIQRLSGEPGGVLGRAPQFSTRSIALASLVVGVVCGVLGGRFARVLVRCRTLRWGVRRRLVTGIVALGVAVPVGWVATGQGIFVGSGDRMLDWARSSSALPVAMAVLASGVVVVALVAADLVGGLLVPLFSIGSLVGVVLAKSFLPSTPTTFVVVAGGCALLAAAYATPATALAVGFALFGWSASTVGVAVAVVMAVTASGRLSGRLSGRPSGRPSGQLPEQLPGQHVHS